MVVTTIVEALQQNVAVHGQKPAFIFRDLDGGREDLSWQQIYRLGGHWAAQLKEKSIGQGHLVVNTLPNSPERAVCEAGILMSGAASVNGQCLMADGSDILDALRKSQAKAIVLDQDIPNNPWDFLKPRVTLLEDHSVTSKDLPHLKQVYFVRRRPGNVEDFLERLESLEDWYQASVKPGHVCTVFTTSGTTGFSKLVVHTHGNLVGVLNPYRVAQSNEPDFNLAPFGWPGGYPGITFMTGVSRILLDQRGAAGKQYSVAEFVWRAVQDERLNRVSLFPGVVVQMEQLLKRREKDIETEGKSDLPAWSWKPERINIGGVPIARDTVRAAFTLAESVYNLYGCTECGFVATNRITDPGTFVDHDAGFPNEGVEVKIVNTEDETVQLPVGELGQILLKSPGVMAGYLNDPAGTAAAFTPDGFYRTGDLGKLDDRGHLIVDGRGGDAIMRDAYIFYPGWLEARIRACPAVMDVAVVGVPDPVYSEELCACLVLTSEHVTTDHVKEFVEKEIVATEDNPPSPRPRYYLRFDSFPMTSTYKLRRTQIKEQAAQYIQAQKQEN